jgi:predicted dehydrogenase
MTTQKTRNTPGLRVGVIGYGGAFNMGRHHLQEMAAAGMIPVAVAEPDRNRLSVATGDFPGIQTYDTVKAMLNRSDVGLVTIITPHNTHASLALQCLQAGRHVVCEKPLAITTAECNSMIATARKKGLLITTYHNRHWDGWIMRAVEQVKKKKAIGQVYRIDARMGRRGQPGDWWRSSRSISGGILYDWGVHLLEYSLQLIDSEISEVSGYAHNGYWAPRTRWKKDTNEDEAQAVVRFRNGVWINLSITQLDSDPKPGFLEIHGTEGSYLLEWNQYTLTRRDQGCAVVDQGNHPASEWHRFYENVADHLGKGSPLVITPEWARRTIHILELAARSARAGRALPAKYR